MFVFIILLFTTPLYTTPPYTTPSYTTSLSTILPYSIPLYTTPPYTTPPYTIPPYTTPPYTTLPYTTPPYTTPPFTILPHSTPSYSYMPHTHLSHTEILHLGTYIHLLSMAGASTELHWRFAPQPTSLFFLRAPVAVVPAIPPQHIFSLACVMIDILKCTSRRSPRHQERRHDRWCSAQSRLIIQPTNPSSSIRPLLFYFFSKAFYLFAIFTAMHACLIKISFVEAYSSLFDNSSPFHSTLQQHAHPMRSALWWCAHAWQYESNRRQSTGRLIVMIWRIFQGINSDFCR